MPSNSDEMYKGQAKRWLVKVIVIFIVGGLVNLILSYIFSGGVYIFLSIITGFGILILSTYLLFRHVDTLILKRLAQSKEDDDV
jgi:uncharacterized protein (DUF58 family)